MGGPNEKQVREMAHDDKDPMLVPVEILERCDSVLEPFKRNDEPSEEGEKPPAKAAKKVTKKAADKAADKPKKFRAGTLNKK